MKLLNYKSITGSIKAVTGLHIGGSSETIEIGGIDNPVIKNPHTREPYIPGSSLKGKMRSLMEWKLNKINEKGDVHRCKDRDNNKTCPICRVFGTMAGDSTYGPTRIIVRDAELSNDFKEKIKNEGLIITEEKTENQIDRVSAMAHPRKLERVPAGVIFDVNIHYRVFDMNDNGITDEDYFKYVLHALYLVQQDALGGYGSRGCGQVEFVNLKVDGEPINLEDYKNIQW